MIIKIILLVVLVIIFIGTIIERKKELDNIENLFSFNNQLVYDNLAIKKKLYDKKKIKKISNYVRNEFQLEELVKDNDKRKLVERIEYLEKKVNEIIEEHNK